VNGSEVRFGAINLLHLRRARLVGTLGSDHHRAIARARWPRLESLTLGVGPDCDPEALVHDLRPILDGSAVPNLVHLGFDLHAAAQSGPLCAALTRAPIVRRLSRLAIDRLDRRGEAALLAGRAAFAHLERLTVSERWPRLKGLCRHVDAGEARLERDGRFVEIEIDEPRVRVREGKIGRAGRLAVIDHGTVHAWRAYHRAIAARRLDGYHLVVNPFAGRADEVPNATLTAAIAAQPDDPEPYRAWAEWNRAWGWTRSELIDLQIALAADPENPRLRQRIAELLGEHDDLLGPLRPHVEGRCSPRLDVVWRFGYLRAATVAPFADDSDPEASADLVRLLLRHPSGRWLEALRVLSGPPGSREHVRRALSQSRHASLKHVLVEG
jgi:hypothetical protein